MARRSLASVIDSWITSKSEAGKPCVMLVLMHQRGNQPIEIMKYPISSTSPTTGEQVSEAFRGRAQAHAQDLPGIQYYNVLAFFQDSQEPFSQQSFKEGGAEDSHGLATEGPTSAGIVQQLMRHSEAQARITAQFTGELFGQMVATISRLTEQNDKLMERHIEVLELSEKVILERAGDTYKKEIEIRDHERNTKLMSEFMALAPALVNTATGKEVFPQAQADKALFDKLADNLTQEHIKMLGSLGLPQELVGMLMARFEKRMKEKREAKDLAIRGPNGS